MKTKLTFWMLFATLLLVGQAPAQTAGEIFNRAARSFVKTAKDQSLKEVNDGLNKYPNDTKLKALKDKLTVLDRALADHTLYAEEPQKAADFMKLRGKLAIDLDQLETDWLQAHG